jgi:ubiquitin-protein ligase
MAALNPQQRRLQSDFTKLQKLAAESGGTLLILHTSGNPPKSYAIEYHCPSLVKEKGELVVREIHQVEINLPGNYPFSQPSARMLTPVFNPHVFPTHTICLGGVWSPAETLDVLVLRIGALLQLDPRVLNPHSPANQDANDWVRRNPQRIPLGQVSFKGPSAEPGRIQWT